MKQQITEIAEEWRDICGYEGLYQVSNLGRVKSLARSVSMASDSKSIRPYAYGRKERILRPGNCRGYRNVRLKKDGRGRTVYVHRLVAESFIDNPNGYLEINHKDRDPANNNADNLEWCPRLYNAHYDGAVERQHAKIRKCVRQFSLNGRQIAEYQSVCEASKETGISAGSISRAARGILSQTNGFVWKYDRVTEQ